MTKNITYLFHSLVVLCSLSACNSLKNKDCRDNLEVNGKEYTTLETITVIGGQPCQIKALHCKEQYSWDLNNDGKEESNFDGQNNITYTFPVVDTVATSKIYLGYEGLGEKLEYNLAILPAKPYAKINCVISEAMVNTMIEMHSEYPNDGKCSFKWNIRGQEFTGDKLQYSFNDIGVYYIELKINNGESEMLIDTFTIKIDNNYQPQISLKTTLPANSRFKVGDEVELCIEDAPANSTFFWNSTAGQMNNTRDACCKVKYDKPGIQKISCDVTNNKLVKSARFSLSISPSPPAPMSVFEAGFRNIFSNCKDMKLVTSEVTKMKSLGVEDSKVPLEFNGAKYNFGNTSLSSLPIALKMYNMNEALTECPCDFAGLVPSYNGKGAINKITIKCKQ